MLCESIVFHFKAVTEIFEQDTIFNSASLTLDLV